MGTYFRLRASYLETVCLFRDKKLFLTGKQLILGSVVKVRVRLRFEQIVVMLVSRKLICVISPKVAIV